MIETTYWIPIYTLYNMQNSTRQMIKSSWPQMLSLVGIISFLLFFLNLLMILSYNTNVFNQNVREKLGVYLYLDDNAAVKDVVYAEAIQMKSDLEQKWMNVDFYSKEDAFQILEDRLPNVIENFEKYGIENPLPPTLYIQFSNEQDYTNLKDIVLSYEDVIMNLGDLETEGFAFTEQERRSANVINLTNFLSQFWYFLIGIILVIIITFLLFGLKLTFYRFWEQIEVEKLLWAWYFHIKKPFLYISWWVLLWAFGLMLVYFAWFFTALNSYFLSVFSVSVYEYLLPVRYIREFLGREFLILLSLWLLFAWGFLSKLIRKV